MDNISKKALYVVLISLGLALAFNFLFFDKEIGVSVFIFNVLLLGAVFLPACAGRLGWHDKLDFRKTWWLVAAILFFALMPGIRANEFLSFLNVCAAFGLLLLLANELTGTPAFLMRLIDYIFLIIGVPFKMLAQAFSTVALVGQIHSKVKNRDTLIRVVKGIIMAAPILIIFGALFSQADLAFARFINSFVKITITERMIQHFVLILLSFTASLCFLSYIFFYKESPKTSISEKSTAVQAGREIEILVFLGLISSLFLLFIGFQITYLFGGEANIANAGFTYAEYARRGFFELLAVAILALLVLLASEKYAEVESKRSERFMMPALILIAEVMIVIVSAFKRLYLYVDAYSLTEPRFYVGAFIVLIFVLFILLAVKFIKLKREEFFAFGALISLIVFFVGLNIINPDAFIARSNLERYNRTGKIDVSHVGRLSADAMPSNVELYGKLEGGDKEALRGFLNKRKERLEEMNKYWQAANLSRFRALKMLEKLH